MLGTPAQDTSLTAGSLPQAAGGSGDNLGTIKLLLEGALDMAVILGPERDVLYANPAYQANSALLGLRPGEVQGKCYEHFCLEICENACAAKRANEVGHAIRMDEIIGKRVDGEDLTLIVTAIPLPGGLTVEMYRDVTAEVRLQQKYKALLEFERRANDQLEQAVAARTDELKRANEELRRSQAQLIHQEKMSSLGRLVAGIAHELNNPINFVYGNVDFLGRYVTDLISLVDLYDQIALPADVRAKIDARKKEIEYDFMVDDSEKLIRSIRSGAERTAAIVRDLKTFSRAGGGSLQEADLVEGLETTVNLCAPLLKNRIRIERDVEKLPKIICHPGHIHQVFMNILTNAAQAIRGPGTIRIRARRLAPEGGKPERVQFTFVDSGPGIPEEIRAHIFDPFFTTKDPGEGTGLGLAISEGIVKAHGGSIELAPSEPGAGATFVVDLPLAPPERTAEGAAAGTERNG